MSSGVWARWFRLVSAASLLAAVAGQALGQSNSAMVTDPGSSVTLTVAFAAETDLGPISGVDSDSADLEGTALITLLPADPPFTHCRVHSLSMSIGQIDLLYRFMIFFTLEVTFTDLVIESTEPFDGTIDEAGSISFVTSPLRVTGDAHVVSAAFLLDDVWPIDAGSDAPMAAHLSAADGTVVWDQIVIASVEWGIPPVLLPEGISAFDVAVDTDADGVVFRGAYYPSTAGDGDADEDIDLFDYSGFAGCLTGPDATGVLLSNVFCGLHMFDDDEDVDLRDLGEFQNAFTGSP